MFDPRLQMNFQFEALSLSADVSLSPLERWFSGLIQRNAQARMGDFETPPRLSVRVHCPSCGARAHALFPADDHRVCRRCGTEFGIES